MKKNILVFLLLGFCSFNGVSADQVSCESIASHSWSWGEWKTCYMQETTQINSADTTIASRDESVQGLRFYNNKKIKFLPFGLSEKFPNLLGLDASLCSIKTISKANFKGLSMLRVLFLNYNQIEKITSDVFDDLAALYGLWLHNNNLKFINGKAFAKLTKLTYVLLSSNPCINEDFQLESRIAMLQQTVNVKCSIDEFELDEYVRKTFSIVSSLADKKCEKSQDLANLTTTIEGMKTETTEARSEVISQLNELKTQQKEECGNIAKVLEAQTKALEATTKTLEAQTKAFKDQQTYFNETLENKTAEIVDVKVKSEMQVMLKMSEIQRLEEQLQRKNAEIIEKNEKIKKLKEKVEALSSNFK